MTIKNIKIFYRSLVAVALGGTLMASGTTFAESSSPNAKAKAVFDFWTPARQAAAKPRDLVIDRRGLGYMRHGDRLIPYGHTIEAQKGKPTDPGGGKGGGNDGGDDGGTNLKTVRNAEWTKGGTVQNAAGRILFAMGPDYFVCSGTVINDSTSDRSVILTAGHCVFDDVNQQFATNVLFIPNQNGTTGTGTDFDCNNDPLGCWAPSHGLVDPNWTATVFPNNIPWDYAYYVVPDSGGHSGSGSESVLDLAAAPMDISFEAVTLDAYTHALGYSYSDDPNFMYCGQNVGIESGYGGLWLGNCKLSGGSSGGPWTQSNETDLGAGPVMSVNSWGYNGKPGMGGPNLSGTTAECLFDQAKISNANTVAC